MHVRRNAVGRQARRQHRAATDGQPEPPGFPDEGFHHQDHRGGSVVPDTRAVACGDTELIAPRGQARIGRAVAVTGSDPASVETDELMTELDEKAMRIAQLEKMILISPLGRIIKICATLSTGALAALPGMAFDGVWRLICAGLSGGWHVN